MTTKPDQLDPFRLSGHLQAEEPDTVAEAYTSLDEMRRHFAGEPTLPDGWHRVPATVLMESATGHVVVLASPDSVYPDLVDTDDNHPHDCDAMGCSSVSHVMLHASMPEWMTEAANAIRAKEPTHAE